MKFPRSALPGLFAVLGLAALARAESGVATIDPRWRDSFAAFDAADREHPPEPGGVVFVGSSSIRLWQGLESQFDPGLHVLQRGFGGSLLDDCARYADRLVLAYRPRLVVVYAGDNDLADGHTPAQVLASYAAFVERVRAAQPALRIAFVSIKPSPLRAALLPDIRAANRLVADYSRAHALEFVDVHTPMLDADGQPRRELFGADALHMNAAGYTLWRTVIADRLFAAPRADAR